MQPIGNTIRGLEGGGNNTAVVARIASLAHSDAVELRRKVGPTQTSVLLPRVLRGSTVQKQGYRKSCVHTIRDDMGSCFIVGGVATGVDPLLACAKI